MTERRIVLAGGGSAGHVNPLLATAVELRGRGYTPVALGTAEGLESQLVPSQGIALVTIPKAPLPRRPSMKLFSLPGKLRRAREIAAREIAGAEAVIGYGGYVSVPAYAAAKAAGVPIVIHEQNVRPGLANRLGARYALAVALTFAQTKLRAKTGLTRVTGLPLRAPIADLIARRATDIGRIEARREAAAALGLDPSRPTLLVTGGSLGALHINRSLVEAAAHLPEDAQILHLTGKGKDDEVRRAVKQLGLEDRWIVLDYLAEMEQALAVADLVLCRSGAGTVAELSALGLPAVYVPLPIGNGEQRLNAAGVVEAGGALLVEDDDFTARTVEETVFEALMQPEQLVRMGAAAAASSVGNGTEKLADLVEMICNDRN